MAEIASASSISVSFLVSSKASSENPFFIKGQVMNRLDFVGYLVSVITV
jgi:hypothetical protein